MVSGVWRSIAPFLLEVDPLLESAGGESADQLPQLDVDEDDDEATLWTVEQDDRRRSRSDGGIGLWMVDRRRGNEADGWDAACGRGYLNAAYDDEDDDDGVGCLAGTVGKGNADPSTECG